MATDLVKVFTSWNCKCNLPELELFHKEQMTQSLDEHVKTPSKSKNCTFELSHEITKDALTLHKSMTGKRSELDERRITIDDVNDEVLLHERRKPSSMKQHLRNVLLENIL